MEAFDHFDVESGASLPQGHVYAGHVPSAKLPAPAPLPRVAPAAQTLLGTAAKTVAYHALVSHAAMLTMQLSPVVEPLSSTPPNSQSATPFNRHLYDKLMLMDVSGRWALIVPTVHSTSTATCRDATQVPTV
jgi:hypothetical protein